jgi:hypothetical protein
VAVEVDLEGRTPVPRWQLAAFCVIVVALLLIIAADVLGYAPRLRPSPDVTESVARLEVSVAEIRTDQEKTRTELLVEQARARAESEKLRIEVRAEFAEIRKLLEEKKKP